MDQQRALSTSHRWNYFHDLHLGSWIYYHKVQDCNNGYERDSVSYIAVLAIAAAHNFMVTRSLDNLDHNLVGEVHLLMADLCIASFDWRVRSCHRCWSIPDFESKVQLITRHMLVMVHSDGQGYYLPQVRSSSTVAESCFSPFLQELLRGEYSAYCYCSYLKFSKYYMNFIFF